MDVVLINSPENIFYLTGYQTLGYYYKVQTCIVSLDSDPILLVRHLEQDNVYVHSWIEKHIVYHDHEDPMAVTKKTLVAAGFEKKNIGVEKVSWFLTVRDLERLQAIMPEAKFKDCSGTVEAGRMIKSPQEIAYIKQAARATEKAMHAGIAATAAGVSEKDVAGEVWKALVHHGSTYPGIPPFITSGARTFVPHATWSGRKIKENDTLYYEIGACVQRYSAPMARCGVVGEPTDEIAGMAEACISALDRAIEAIKPGTTSDEVNNTCKEALAEGGWGSVHLHRAGYSIGICFPPSWLEGHILSLQAGDPTVLQSGMVFHVVPALVVSGVAGVVISDTVLVTDKGGEALTNFARKLFIR